MTIIDIIVIIEIIAVIELIIATSQMKQKSVQIELRHLLS